VFARAIAEHLSASLKSFPAAFLTGPRQSGKTTLAKQTLRGFAYFSFEDLDTRQWVTNAPRGFLQTIAGSAGAIFNEVQRV
jgi:predicted AAA+ superfamily ATPase